jgi:hypothetical protein
MTTCFNFLPFSHVLTESDYSYEQVNIYTFRHALWIHPSQGASGTWSDISQLPEVEFDKGG